MPAFRGLGEAERARIVGLFSETSLAKGETVYQAGDEADALYLVVVGAVDVVDGTRSVARYGPGEIFGEAVLVPGERRAVTTRVALDAVLVFLTRESLALLLELHPSLVERVAVLLGNRLKQAARIVNDGARRPSEIVVLQGWTSAAERRAFVELLAEAIEAELGRRVSIVTVASPGGTSAAAVRGDRPDAIVAADAHERGTLRDRLSTELAIRGEQAPVVLVDLDGDLDGPGPSLSLLADTVLVRMDGQPTAIGMAIRGASRSCRTNGPSPAPPCRRTRSSRSRRTRTGALARWLASPAT
jgi:CRP-like cAMP-binding protein